MSSIGDPKRIERDALDKLDASYRQLLSRHERFFETFQIERNKIDLLYRNMGLFGVPDSATVSSILIAENQVLHSILGHCNHLVEWQDYFLTFEATARHLNNSGFPQVGGRLWEIEKELGGALNQCREIAASRVEYTEANLRIAQNTGRGTIQTIQRAHNNWARTFDDFLKRWSDTTFNKCPFCGFFLHSRTFPYCPYCKVLVRQ